MSNAQQVMILVVLRQAESSIIALRQSHSMHRAEFYYAGFPQQHRLIPELHVKRRCIRMIAIAACSGGGTQLLYTHSQQREPNKITSEYIPSSLLVILLDKHSSHERCQWYQLGGFRSLDKPKPLIDNHAYIHFELVHLSSHSLLSGTGLCQLCL